MIIYDQTSIAFIQRTEGLLKEILVSLGFEVRTKRFVFKKLLYPINVVVFEGGSEPGFTNGGVREGVWPDSVDVGIRSGPHP